jgi:hypothetical protein
VFRIRQHTSAFVCIHTRINIEDREITKELRLIDSIVEVFDGKRYLYTSAQVSIRQHTSAYVSIRQEHTSAYVSAEVIDGKRYQQFRNGRQASNPHSLHTSAYVSIRQDTRNFATTDKQVIRIGQHRSA